MRVVPVVLLAGLLGVCENAWADAPSRLHCFSSSDFENWRAPDTKTVYIRAVGGRIYRFDLARECVSLRYPDSKLIMTIRGGSRICSAVDLELRATGGFGNFPEPCFARLMTELSPAEVDALPKNSKP